MRWTVRCKILHWIVGIASAVGFAASVAVVTLSRVKPYFYPLGAGYYLAIDSAAYATLIDPSTGAVLTVSPKVTVPLIPLCGAVGTVWVGRATRASKSKRSRGRGFPVQKIKAQP